ncbi:MAG: hypothetical protein KA213_07895 [Flavobacterium sp.]|nr:hypothetical protein [Flavobacterium sp.]
MRSIFRKLRQGIAKNQTFVTYLKYAFGEIVLVVLGILIALQINNWNEDRKQQIIIDNYYSKIIAEVESVNKLIEYNAEYTETANNDLMFCIKYMEQHRTDSTNVFINKIKKLTDCDSQTLYFPVINEFISKGFISAVNNTKIKDYIDKFIYVQDQAKISDLERTAFCVNQLQPFIQKNINYSDIMVSGGGNKTFNLPKIITVSGPKTDFNNLMSNIELWNLIYRKVEIERNTIVVNKSFIGVLSELSKEIKKELDKN